MGLREDFLAAAKRAFDKTAQDFAIAQQEQMDAEVYDWPRTTERSSGEVVSSPRDIVDTGELKESLEVSEVSRFQYEYYYPPDYAAIVHEGGKTASGREYPARPWIEDSAIAMDIQQTLGEYLADEL